MDTYKNYSLDTDDRHEIKQALTASIKVQRHRISYLTRQEAIDDSLRAIATAAGLLVKLNEEQPALKA
jgi:hypothetical protein